MKKVFFAGLLLSIVSGGIVFWYFLRPVPNEDVYAELLVERMSNDDPLQFQQGEAFVHKFDIMTPYVTHPDVLDRALDEIFNQLNQETDNRRESFLALMPPKKKRWLSEHLQIKQFPGGSLRISFPVEIPTEDAVLIINSVAQAFQERANNKVTKADHEIYEYLEMRIETVKSRIDATRESLSKFQTELNDETVLVTRAEAYRTRLLEELADLQVELLRCNADVRFTETTEQFEKSNEESTAVIDNKKLDIARLDYSISELKDELARLVHPVSRVDSSPQFQALSNQLEQLQTELHWLEEKMFQSRYRMKTRPAPVTLVHPAKFPID
ncbi:MAG: hypothetical protein HUJ26_22595 [Planctomycetaceae bacterium]|nr:hypothetical protein [Planctomycetaceae bacterium]